MRNYTLLFIIVSLLVAAVPVTQYFVKDPVVLGAIFRAGMVLMLGCGIWWERISPKSFYRASLTR